MTELCKKIWRNGEFIDWKDATVHVCAHAMHYGSSVFEGIRAYNVGDQAGIFRLSEHVRRLIDSAKIYRMDVKFTQEQLEKACIYSVRENGFNECYIRPLIYRDYGP
ncbi:MAG: aminotransferase class IV, partial [Planctomycetota bacterium]